MNVYNKIVLNEITYFIREDVYEHYVSRLNSIEERAGKKSAFYELQLLRISDAVIKDNQIVKCRFDLEDMMTVYVNHNKELAAKIG